MCRKQILGGIFLSNIKKWMSKWEMINYASLDFSQVLIYMLISSYLLYFYTDVAKIPVAAAGVILLIARCFDAVDAPHGLPLC